MRALLAIARKDLLVRFSSRSEWLFFLILPLAFTAIVGGGFSFGSDDDPRLPLPVVDEDRSNLSAALLADLAESKTVRVIAQSRSDIEDGDTAAALVIPAAFGASLEAGMPGILQLVSAPGEIDALAVGEAVRESAARVGLSLAAASASLAEAERRRPFADEAERQAYFEEGFRLAQEARANSPERLRLTLAAEAARRSGLASYNQAAQASAGGIITWVFIPLLGISAMFAYERTSGTLRRLVTTPVSRSTFLLGTIGGQSLTALGQITLLVVFSVAVFQVPWGQSPAALAVVMVAFVLSSAALGTTLGTFVRSEAQASGLSIMLGMVLSLLGGCWYPIELFPPAVQTAVHIFPTTWAMQAMTDITMRGQGLVQILPEAAVLLGFALVFFIVGVVRFRYE
jgi:ABC-2 type transport system permease protein